MGADTKTNTQELVRAPGGLLERLQRGVALEALRERSSCLRAETVERETASTWERRWGLRVSMGIDRKANTRAAAHFSSLSTPFSLMQLAMMMAEATPRCLLERSIFSVGFVPLSSSI
eukprot:scaffold54666_cov68-Phaeocystis_antarctica.AAC.7